MPNYTPYGYPSCVGNGEWQCGNAPCFEIPQGFRMWPWVMVRGTGFPVQWVEGLRAPELGEAARSYLALDEQFDHQLEETMKWLDGQPSSRNRTKAFRALKLRKIPKTLEKIGGHSHLEKFEQLNKSREKRFAQLATLLESNEEHLRHNLRAIASDSLFQEALTWQNPTAATRICTKLQNPPCRPNFKYRQQQQTAVSYIQRYCTKNDTIGFFGPIRWGQLGVKSPNLQSPSLKERRVYFEDWAIRQIGIRLENTPELLPWAIPRLATTLRIKNSSLWIGNEEKAQLPAHILALLKHLNGAPAIDIAKRIAKQTPELFADHDEVYETMSELCELKLLTWKFELPAHTESPVNILRRHLSKAPDEIAGPHIEALDTLESKRAAVQAAAGDHSQLASALTELKISYEELFSIGSERKAGQMYAGRHLIYEDFLQSPALSLSSKHFSKLNKVLLPILLAGRWHLRSIEDRILKLCMDIYSKHAQRSEASLPFTHLLAAIQENIVNSPNLFERTTQQLREKWNQILSNKNIVTQETPTQIALQADLFAQACEDLFESPAPRGGQIHFISPDIMCMGASTEDIREGNCCFVLGELHIGYNTISAPFIQRFHPNQDKFLELFYDSQSSPIIGPHRNTSDGSRAGLTLPQGEDEHDFYEIVAGDYLSRFPQSKQLRIGDLFVELSETGVLSVRDLRSKKLFPLPNFLAGYWQGEDMMDAFELPFDSLEHTPRVMLGENFVLRRESWSFSSETIPAFPARGLDQFLAVHSWASKQGFPRQVFFKSAEEIKPVYLDFESPILVENFCAIAKKSTGLKLSEMLPTTKDAWLPGKGKALHTCEFRFVVEDCKQH